MIEGVRQLETRMTAISKVAGRPLLGRLALAAVAEQKALVQRKTGTTGRSIRVGQVTDAYAETVVGGAGLWLERGARPHIIRPRNRRVLAWPATAAGRRLSGRARRSTRRGANGGLVFARIVRHPGTRKYPFMLPGAQRAVARFGFAAEIVRAWNSAR